jgi:hypothetical protein
MKKKILIFGALLVALLFFGFNVFAIEFNKNTYEPFEDNILISCVGGEVNFYTGYYGGEGNWSYSGDVGGCDDVGNVISNKDEGEYVFVEHLFGEEGAGNILCGGSYYDCVASEYFVDEFFFDVEIPASPTIPFVDISTNFISGTLAYIGQAVSGLGPLLYVLAGIPFAFWVVKKVLSLIPKK